MEQKEGGTLIMTLRSGGVILFLKSSLARKTQAGNILPDYTETLKGRTVNFLKEGVALGAVVRNA